MDRVDAVKRVKQAIDRQLSGEIDWVFPENGPVRIMLTNVDTVFVRTAAGDFAITKDIEIIPAVIEAVN